MHTMNGGQKAGWNQGGVRSINAAAHRFQKRDEPVISSGDGMNTIGYGDTCRDGNTRLL